MPGFYNAIMKDYIPNPEIAIWFQRMVVLMEICIGLALLAGLFTFLASAASAFLVTNFVLSAMGGLEYIMAFLFLCHCINGWSR